MHKTILVDHRSTDYESHRLEQPVSYVLRVEQELSPTERTLFRSRYDRGSKSRAVATVLGIFLGVWGAHRFYMGQVGAGIAYLLLLGWTALVPFLGVLVWLCVLVEVLVTSGDRVDTHNRELAREVRNELVYLRESDAQEARHQDAGSLVALERLASLREKGHLSEAEFEDQKRKMLGAQ